MEYLSKKYASDFIGEFDGHIDNKAINEYFSNYVGYINDNEFRKYEITNDDDNGLLLILALITDSIEG